MKDDALPAMMKAQELGDKSEGHVHRARPPLRGPAEWDKALEAFGKGEPNARDMLLIGQMFVFQGRDSSARTAADSARLASAESTYRAILRWIRPAAKHASR